tara:strand:- start:204 stop:503 length:300 start_codon:yes stop_codon:yes gene_type:complete
MALPKVPSTNVGIFSSLRVSTSCNETTNISLASLCTGGNVNGIDHTFSAAGGPAVSFDKLGGTNNPLNATFGVARPGDLLNIGLEPFNLSHTIGGQYEE